MSQQGNLVLFQKRKRFAFFDFLGKFTAFIAVAVTAIFLCFLLTVPNFLMELWMIYETVISVCAQRMETWFPEENIAAPEIVVATTKSIKITEKNSLLNQSKKEIKMKKVIKKITWYMCAILIFIMIFGSYILDSILPPDYLRQMKMENICSSEDAETLKLFNCERFKPPEILDRVRTSTLEEPPKLFTGLSDLAFPESFSKVEGARMAGKLSEQPVVSADRLPQIQSKEDKNMKLTTLISAVSLALATTAVAETPSQPSDCKGTETEVLQCLSDIDHSLNGETLKVTVPKDGYTAGNFAARGQLATTPAAQKAVLKTIIRPKPRPERVKPAPPAQTALSVVSGTCTMTYRHAQTGELITKKSAFGC